MFDEAQTFYLSEVLGLNPDPLAWGVESARRADLVILHRPTSPEEQALLDKILLSVSVPEGTARVPTFELENLDLSQISSRVLTFSGKSQRESKDGSSWWHLPELHQMLGQGPEVNRLKKLAWGLLQDLAEDLRK